MLWPTDYYPFGMGMPGRKFVQASSKYRYGFNGKENDNEVSGDGNQYDYGFRVYNPRIGRFLSVDPLSKTYPWYTPYQFTGNMPIVAIDLDGLEEKIVTYSTTADGKLKTVTVNGLTLIQTTQISGSYAMHEPISYNQWRAYKKSIFDGISVLKNNFANGYEVYTSGRAGQNDKDFSGYNHGTLTIGAGTNGLSIGFDPTPVNGNPTTIDAVKMGWKGAKEIWSDPGITEVRGNVLTCASLIFGIGELMAAKNFIQGAKALVDVASTTDDLIGASAKMKAGTLKTIIGGLKESLAIYNSIDGVSKLKSTLKSSNVSTGDKAKAVFNLSQDAQDAGEKIKENIEKLEKLLDEKETEKQE